MNALELRNALALQAKKECYSFKEMLQLVKTINSSIKKVNIFSEKIESITLGTEAEWPVAHLSVSEFLTIIEETSSSDLSKKNCLHTDATVTELTIKFVDTSCCTFSSRSISQRNSPPSEICDHINFLVKNKFNTAWS